MRPRTRTPGGRRGPGRCRRRRRSVVEATGWSRDAPAPRRWEGGAVRKHKNCSAQSFLEVPPARIEKVPPRQPQQDQRGRRRGQGDAASPQPYRTRSTMRPGVLAADWQAIPKRSTRLLAGTEAEPWQGDPHPAVRRDQGAGETDACGSGRWDPQVGPPLVLSGNCSAGKATPPQRLLFGYCSAWRR